MPGNPAAGLFGISRRDIAPEYLPMQLLQFVRLHLRESVEGYRILYAPDNS